MTSLLSNESEKDYLNYHELACLVDAEISTLG
jgi:hypothetical protein